MTNTNTLIKSMEFVSGKNSVSNESILEVYEHVKIIADTGIWNEDSFYIGAPEHFKALKDKKFGSFLKEAYGKSSQWFVSMNDFLSIENGKALFIKYGHKNMASYLRFTKEERNYVLSVVKDCPTSNFSYILSRAGMRSSNGSNVIEATNSEWKKKYEYLKKEHTKLKEKYEALVAENNELKKTVKNMKKILS